MIPTRSLFAVLLPALVLLHSITFIAAAPAVHAHDLAPALSNTIRGQHDGSAAPSSFRLLGTFRRYLIRTVSAVVHSSRASPAAIHWIVRSFLPVSISSPAAGGHRQTARRLSSITTKLAKLPGVGTVEHQLTRSPVKHVSRVQSAPSFLQYFGNGIGSMFEYAGPYANGQPFDCGWDPSLGHCGDDVLNLVLTNTPFTDNSATGGGITYPFSASEIITPGYYGAGCYSVCMKPPAISGVSANIFTIADPYDSPPDLGYTLPLHFEIDIEFIGKNTSVFQSNYFYEWENRQKNSASGNEMLHPLGFDAAQDFNCYSFIWSSDSIQWFANGQPMRTVYASQSYIPDPGMSTMRMAANVWAVNQQAEEWAGPKPPGLSYAVAQYRWIQYDAGGNCKMTC